VSYRKGQMSTTEKTFIRSSSGKLTPDQIAESLNRSPKQVRAYLDEHNVAGVAIAPPEGEEAELLEVRHKLRRTMAWQHLREELANDELAYFEEKYSQYMTQFREDVLVTEETQIFLVIKLEIMMHRNSTAKRSCAVDIERLSKLRDNFQGRFSNPSDMSDSERDYLLQLETQITACKAAEAAKSNEFIKLEEKHQALLKDLKATRDQRVSRIESSKETFLGVIRRLQDEGQKEFAGRHMELLRVAANREGRRLGSAHKYDDGIEDLPVLNAETVGEEDAE
jgi:hypothetical protein